MAEDDSDCAGLMKYVREFLLEDYRLKVGMVTQHYQRILIRFNYFLAIQSSLVVVNGFLIKEHLHTAIFFLCVAGLVSSVFWFITSHADRKVAIVYRDDIVIVYRHILQLLLKSQYFRSDAERSLALYEERLLLAQRCGINMPDFNALRGLECKIRNEQILVAAADTGMRGALVIFNRLPPFSVTRMPQYLAATMIFVWLLGFAIAGNFFMFAG